MEGYGEVGRERKIEGEIRREVEREVERWR